MSFRVDPEHIGAHRPADTYDVVHADNYELVIANVTHQQATFIASVLNGRTEADIKAEALREAADAWQISGWADDMPPAGANRPALILGMAQRATNFLQRRADQIGGQS